MEPSQAVPHPKKDQRQNGRSVAFGLTTHQFGPKSSGKRKLEVGMRVA